MSTTLGHASQVVPAHLSFLAIYNPSLGRTDESVKEQIVFYSSPRTQARRSRKHDSQGHRGAEREEENEQLRQVGLAQGMVDFAKNFSDGESIDTIETEKSRIVLHEIEEGWWILASVDLSQLPSSRPVDRQGTFNQDTIEYSSREVSPPQLMLQHLLQAHSIFLLHHAASLNDLYLRLPRPSFCTLLDRFWTRFVWQWDVLLHGNPAVDIYNGIKLAGGGELGIGVGEEEWGSGEREVLEDFIARTEGLVDLVVSRFGDAPEEPSKAALHQTSPSPPRQHQEAPWLAADLELRPSDGVLFAGVGAISRRSLATVSQWMADIYRYGEDAYGVGENPTARPRKKKQRGFSRTRQLTRLSTGQNSVKRKVKSPVRGRPPLSTQITRRHEPSTPGIPPPLVKIVEHSLENATAKASSAEPSRSPTKEQQGSQDEKQDPPVSGTDTVMKYLSLGYGSAWTLNPKGLSKSEPHPVSRQASHVRPQDKFKEESSGAEIANDPGPPKLDVIEPTPEVSDDEGSAFVQRLEQSIGKFLIGLSGDLENQDLTDDDTDGGPRIILRILTVELHAPSSATERQGSIASSPSTPRPGPDSSDFPSKELSSPSTQKQLQVAIYVHQPFIFTFLFDLHTPSLTYPSFYRSIHHQLGPLQKPLLRSTDPINVAARIAHAMGEGTTTTATAISAGNSATATPPIYDLIYDPEKLTIHGSLPNIPPPASLVAEGQKPQTVSGSWYTLGIPTSSSSSSSPANPVRRSIPQAPGSTNAAAALPPLSNSPNWSRIEALNVHTQILHTYISTRRLKGELERTVKTGRGWWVLWMRVQGSVSKGADDGENCGRAKEAVLVRRSREDGRGGGSSFARIGGRGPGGVGGMGWLARDGGRMRDGSGSSAGGGAGATMGVSGVVEGVGVDARRWVEGLLSLNR